MATDDDGRISRRKLLTDGARAVGLLAVAGGLGTVLASEEEETVWQIDPDKCIQCGNCATACVLTPSAVKCVHDIAICGFCDLCFGYFAEQRPGDTETAENLRCPTDAIVRNFVENPYYEYMIDEPKCIGCGVCVEGCQQYGNGALILQVRHDRCKNCNECSIAVQCPAQAFTRVPAGEPYLLRSAKLQAEEESAVVEGGPPVRRVEPAQPVQPGGTQQLDRPFSTPQGLPESGPLEVPTRPEPAPGSPPNVIDAPGGLGGGGPQPVAAPDAGGGPPPPDANAGGADNLQTILGVDEL